jgi:antitoxin HigA-1
MIKEVYIEPLDLSINEISRMIGVNQSTFNRLVNKKSAMTPEMALRVSKVIGRSPESWLAMQANYDLWNAKNGLDLDDLKPLSIAVELKRNLIRIIK